MKKIFSLVSALVAILVLSACKEPDPIYVNVPGPVEYVEITKKVEVPVVKIEKVTEYVDKIVEVPINVKYERFYKPGVYFNHTNINSDGIYTFVVVVVDDYGKIAGIMFDDTKSSSEFYKDDEDNLYVFIEGDGKSVPHTYRYIPSDTQIDEYPTNKDAITADDLVMGIHQTKIEKLTEVKANETSRILGEEWVKYTDLLAEKIIEDQTTYGINLFKSGNEVTTSNVPGVKLTNVDLYIDLVQKILNNEASEPNLEELKKTPQKGLYTPGGKFGVTKRIVEDSIFYYTSFVTVDEFGKIAGVYNDATADGVKDDQHATRWILKEDYKVDNVEWYKQAKAFGQAVTRNQGVDGFNLFSDKEYTNESSLPQYSKGGFIFINEEQEHVYTNQIPGTTVGIEGMIAATQNAFSKFDELQLEDGTYFAKGSGDKEHSFIVLTIEEGVIESICLDSTKSTDQAEVYRDNEWLSLYKFERTWINESVNRQESETILVYKDGRDYHSLNEVKINGDIIDPDDEIDLTDEEETTLEPIRGNNTIMALGERYELGDTSSDGEWNEQITIFTKYFEGKKSPYGINIDNGYTDSIDGVSIKVMEYHQLIVDALILAQDAGNAILADMSISSSAPDLANGTYFASLEPNIDGEQPFAFMTVKNNKIQSIIYDSTTSQNGLVTTKLSLGDEYGLAKDYDDLEWYEQSIKISKEILSEQRDIVKYIEDGYDYQELNGFGDAPYFEEDPTNSDEFELDLESIDGITIDLNDFKHLTDKLIQQALYKVVEEKANLILDTIIDGKTPLVSGEVYPHNLTDDLEFGSAQYEFDVDWRTSDNDVFDVPDDGDDIVVDDVNRNENESLTLTISHYDQEFSKEVEFEVLSIPSAELALIDEQIKEEFTDLVIVEGYDKNLGAERSEYIDVDWLWYDDDDDRIFSTENLSVGKHTLTLELEYEEDEFVKREVEITIVDLDDAMEDVVNNLTPGNILDNGDVTKENTITLPKESKYKGITIEWEIDLDGSADGINLNDNLLSINRTYSNEKVVLTATIANDVNTDNERLDFEFRVLAADKDLVEKRINEKLDEILNDPNTKLPDRIIDTKKAGTSEIILVNLDDIVVENDFDYDEADVSWNVYDKYGNLMTDITDYNGDLRISDTIDGIGYLTLSVTADVNDDDKIDVKVKRVFELEFFISTW